MRKAFGFPALRRHYTGPHVGVVQDRRRCRYRRRRGALRCGLARENAAGRAALDPDRRGRGNRCRARPRRLEGRRRRRDRGRRRRSRRRPARGRNPAPGRHRQRHRHPDRPRRFRDCGARACPVSRLPRSPRSARAGRACPSPRARAVCRSAHARSRLVPHSVPKKLILIVIDGLTPAAFELAAQDDRTPALKFLAANGKYGRGISTFPSLTPVCLSSIATGAHPDVHRIPHLVWYHRGERRIVEYGSSFAAGRPARPRPAPLAARFYMNQQHPPAARRGVFQALEAAGGPDEFLDRYAVILCADHGQTQIERTVRLEERFADARVIVTASNRAGMVYRTDKTGEDTRELAARLDSEPGADAVLFLEGDEAVARRGGGELRFVRAASGGGTGGGLCLLPQPDALERAWAAPRNPNAGELIVSAADGVEFADLAGRSHLGGGSHGALPPGAPEA